MGLFKKEVRNNKEKNREELPKLPELPRLPELPEFSGIGERLEEDIPQLPTFPNGSLGNKFSQDTIKDAVTGKKEAEDFGADDFVEEDFMQKMRRPLVREEKEIEYPSFEKPSFGKETSVKGTEPLFVRIDKFEESSQILEEVRKKISDIEKMFRDIKKIKEEEETELASWGEEIIKIKEKIEKIDKNIFSKLD